MKVGSEEVEGAPSSSDETAHVAAERECGPSVGPIDRPRDFAELVALVWPEQERRFSSLLEEEAGACRDLTQAVRHQVQSGGKRLRAVLPLTIHRCLAETVDRTREDAAIWAGLSLELTHAATLCHDDVMDEDTMRRDVSTVWVLHGVPQAINAGDLLFFLAAQALERAQLAAEESVELFRRNSAAMRRLAHGQGRETALRRLAELPTLEEWHDIARLKTGALFAYGMALGAVTARANQRTTALLDEVGLRLGVVFQLQDDLIDLLGTKGRATASDLWEGKPSWLIADCASRLPAPTRSRLATVLYEERATKTPDAIVWLRQLLEDEGADRRGLEKLNELTADLLKVVHRELPSLDGTMTSLVDRIRRPLARVLPPLDRYLSADGMTKRA